MKQSDVSRRSFLLGSLSMLAAGVSTPKAHARLLMSDNSRIIANDPRRPQYHLLPNRNWINDPNGPIYFRGKYHMFFQYNPESAIWGNMSWNHAVSDDMIHWQNYPVAFTMTPGGPDAAGCFSGSTIVRKVDGKARVYAIYTGVVRDKAEETIRNEGLRESQCIAWSDDPLLGKWTKRSYPVIPAPPPGLKVVGFRDPAVWEQDGSYFMTVGSGIEKVGGCVLLYRSDDLIDWHYMHPLVTGSWNGKATSNPVDDGEMWECPEVFELDGQHLLIYSTERKVFWQSGVLDSGSMTFKQKKSGLLDLGAFYAPKSQRDAEGVRVLWGWIPERRSQEEMLKAGWSGVISLPRTLSLDNDGSLRMEFSARLKGLRKETLKTSKKGDRKILVVPRATGEFLCSGRRGDSWEMRISLPMGKTLSLKYTAEQNAFHTGDSSVALQTIDDPSIHAFCDGSVFEILLGGRMGMTERFYFDGDVAPDIEIEVLGQSSKLRGWALSAISKDRLTSAVSIN